MERQRMKKSVIEKKNSKLLKRSSTRKKFESIKSLKVDIDLNQIIFKVKQNIMQILICREKKFYFIFVILYAVSEKQETSKELKAITDAMNDYYSHLSAVENVIKNWDPLKKVNIHKILQF